MGVYFLLGPKERRREASISLSVSNEWTSIKSYEDFGGAISSVIWSRVRQRRSEWKELCRRTVWCLSDRLGGILNQQRRPGIKLQETLRGKYSTAPHRSEHLDCFSSKPAQKYVFPSADIQEELYCNQPPGVIYISLGLSFWFTFSLKKMWNQMKAQTNQTSNTNKHVFITNDVLPVAATRGRFSFLASFTGSSHVACFYVQFKIQRWCLATLNRGRGGCTSSVLGGKREIKI